MICLKNSQRLFCKQLVINNNKNFSSTIIFFGLAYGSVSQFFQRYPHLLHKKYNQNNEYLNNILEKSKTVTVAHRGGAHEVPENTIQAFEHAKNRGSKILEMDLCLTKDKEVVVSHDKHIERVTGNKQNLNELNYADINHYQKEVELEFTEKKEYMKISNSQDYYIPKFEEVLKKFPDSILLVDLKEPNQELIQKTYALIEKYNSERNIILGSQFIDDWNSVKSFNNFERMFSSQNHLIKIHIYHILGLLPFCKLDISTLATPLFTQAYYQWEMELSEGKPKRKLMMKLQFMLIKIFNFFNRSLFEHLRKRGVLTFYWVANKREEIERALKDKPSGIVTDYPTLSKQMLSKTSEEEELQQ